MSNRIDDNEPEPTPEHIRKVVDELKAMGLIVDSGRRRHGKIVWITADQAQAEQKRRIN